MEKLKKIESIVENILDAREDARSSDDILYLYVCEYLHEGVSSMTVNNFFQTRNVTSCPSFASVTRARRKVFEKRPELKPERVTRFRECMEDIFVDYAING